MRGIFLVFILFFFLSSSAFSFGEDGPPPGGGCSPDDPGWPECDGVESPLDDWVLVLVGITVVSSVLILKKSQTESEEAI